MVDMCSAVLGMQFCPPTGDSESGEEDTTVSLDRKAVIAGLGAVPIVRSFFSGAVYRTAAHMEYIRTCRHVRRSTKALATKTRAQEALETMWNSSRLREGDKVGTGGCRQHPNRWDINVVIKHAFKLIGKPRCERSGIDGQHRALAIVSTVASVLAQWQDTFVQQRLTDALQLGSKSGGGSVCFYQHFYDATPVRLGFGRMRDVLHPHARYIVLDKSGTKWELVSHESFIQRTGIKVARFGVCEVLGQIITFHVALPDDTIDGLQVLCHPQILQRSNGSCIYSATQECCKSFSHDEVVKMCSKVSLFFVSERPDACSSNIRKRAKSEA